MQYKNLANTKTCLPLLGLALCLNFIVLTNTQAQITQNEPSKRFGLEPTYQPSVRYMPSLANVPSRRLGSQQVGEASLEIVRRKVTKSAPGPEELVAKADKLLESDQIEKAIELYRNVISSNPKTTSAQLGLASALLEKGEYEDALKELSKMLELSPNSSEGQINFGVALYRSGDINKSIEHYEKIIDIVKEKEDLASTNYNLAVAYSHKGNFKKAITHYQLAIDSRKDYPQAYNNLGLIYEVVSSETVEESEKNIKLAKQSFLTAIEQRKGQYPLAYYNLARIYANEHNYQEAIAQFSIAVKQKTNFAEAYLDLGNAYLLKTILTLQNELPQAIDAFQKAIGIRKDNYPLAHENLAIAFSIIGQSEKAYPHYRKAIDQYKEPSLQTLHNIISTVQKKRSFLIGNELSRSEDVSNLRRQRDPKKLLEQLSIVLEQYENLDDEFKSNQTLRYCAGHAYASVGNWENALDEFAAAVELSTEKDQGVVNAIREILSLIKYY